MLTTCQHKISIVYNRLNIETVETVEGFELLRKAVETYVFTDTSDNNAKPILVLKKLSVSNRGVASLSNLNSYLTRDVVFKNLKNSAIFAKTFRILLFKIFLFLLWTAFNCFPMFNYI